MNYTYILKCSDGTYYTGWTNDMAKRLKTHNEGKGAKYTRARLPVTLAYYEAFETKEEAMRREWEIKRAAALVLIRGGKERLAGDNIHIDALFKLIPELACESALRAALLGDAVRFDTSRFLLSGEAGLTPTLRAPWAMQWRAAGTF